MTQAPAAERLERIDFALLLDRLQEVLEAGSHMPLSSRVLIDQQDCLAILDQMRLALPVELEQARRVLAEQESMLTQARREADGIVEDARKRASNEALRHEIVREARVLAAEIEHQAAENADQARAEVDEYARKVLHQLTARVEQTLKTLRLGSLEMDRSAGPPELDDSEPGDPHVPPRRTPRRPRRA